MGYYGRRSYRSWRSRGWGGASAPSKFSVLQNLLGGAVGNIRSVFLNLDNDALEEILSDYGAIYGDSAERYAKNTFPKWKSGTTKLSGQTMERLVELVPPYLSPEARFSLLKIVLKQHKLTTHVYKTIKINVKEPAAGFQELKTALESMSHDAVLAHLPEKAMKAASWLYDDDITAARSMLAEAECLENDMIRATAAREIELLRRTIGTGQVKAANYSVAMPAGKLNVIAFTPSKCFVATVCFGENAPETETLRNWRDRSLVENKLGRKFIVWYYNNGEYFAGIASRWPVLKKIVKTFISIIAKNVANK